MNELTLLSIYKIVYKKVKSNQKTSPMAFAGKKRPADVLSEPLQTGDASNEDPDSSQKAKVAQKKHKPLPESKFGGMTEEEVCKLLLPDHMKPGLDIIFVRE